MMIGAGRLTWCGNVPDKPPEDYRQLLAGQAPGLG
jgi:hypothetical protein